MVLTGYLGKLEMAKILPSQWFYIRSTVRFLLESIVSSKYSSKALLS